MKPISDFLAVNDHPADVVLPILKRAVALASCWQARQMPRSLEGFRIALIRDDGGWGTHAICSPLLHQLPTLLEEIASSIGSFKRVTECSTVAFESPLIPRRAFLIRFGR